MDSAPHYQLGLTYRKLGQVDLARQILERMQFARGRPDIQ